MVRINAGRVCAFLSRALLSVVEPTFTATLAIHPVCRQTVETNRRGEDKQWTPRQRCALWSDNVLDNITDNTSDSHASRTRTNVPPAARAYLAGVGWGVMGWLGRKRRGGREGARRQLLMAVTCPGFRLTCRTHARGAPALINQLLQMISCFPLIPHVAPPTVRQNTPRCQREITKGWCSNCTASPASIT